MIFFTVITLSCYHWILFLICRIVILIDSKYKGLLLWSQARPCSGMFWQSLGQLVEVLLIEMQLGNTFSDKTASHLKVRLTDFEQLSFLSCATYKLKKSIFSLRKSNID